MLLSNLFGASTTTPNLNNVVAMLTTTIWKLLHDQPEVLASPYARVVLKSDGSIRIADDRRRSFLDVDDVALIFLTDHPVVVKDWLGGLRRDINTTSQRRRTEEFAQLLVQTLFRIVKQENSRPWLQHAAFESTQQCV